MNKHAILHISDVPYAYGIDKDTLRIKLRTAKNDIKICNIYYKCRYDWNNLWNIKKMDCVDSDELFEFFQTDIQVYRNRYRYYFEFIDNEGKKNYYDERGFRDKDLYRNEATAFQFAYLAKADLYEECKWLQESIVYQIFPDRFYNGDKKNDPKGVCKWGEKITSKSMFGGDIKGIIDKIDYLKELGVSLIYLTPIFLSSSNHKYNTADYYKIDPQFGDIEVVKRLVNECHKRNIRIVLDAVFNHSGEDFFAFKDILKNQEKSKYLDWYFIDKHPVSIEKCNYYTFAEKCSNMPKFNTANEEVRNYLLDVAKFWVEEVGIDGWRLDVCDEVDHDFWRAFRKVVKSVQKNAIVVGEIMHESSSFLKGEQLDSIMNYPFKGAMIDFFAKRVISAEEFNDILSRNRSLYMNSIIRQLWNLFDSHDTARFLTESNNDIERMMLAVIFQFMYIGVPYIYYGDEVGLEGGEDPQCRKCMIWNEEKQNKILLNHYKELIKLRKDNKVLVYGEYKTIYVDDKVIAFERYTDNEKILVIINNGENIVNIPLDYKGNYKELYTNEIIKINKFISLGKMSFKVIRII